MSQLVLLGAPGSGKGTQAKKLVREKGYEHVSTGDLLRREASQGGAMGKEIEKILRRGDLVDDLTVLDLLESNCDLNSKKYIFDGFPRNIDQAQLLEERLLKSYAHKGIYFRISTDEIMERLKHRRVCRNCGAVYNLRSMPPAKSGVCDDCGATDAVCRRDDDRAEAVANRLTVYNNTISPVLEYYRSRHLLLEVEAGRSSEEVFGDLLEALF